MRELNREPLEERQPVVNSRFEMLPIEAKRRIDAICTQFEAAWKNGRPQLEAFYASADEADKPALLIELLHIELEFRQRAGESPQLADYAGRFPDKLELIASLFPDPSTTLVTGPRNKRTGLVPRLQPDSGPPEVPGYEILEEIGRGGMGVVYKARNKGLNRVEAVKFILPARTMVPRQQERFRREAEIIAKLNHRNIVHIYQIGEVQGQTFLALEYVDGGSLRDRLTGNPVKPTVAAGLIEQLARGMQHAHRKGVIHRDIKPANILLARYGDSMGGPVPAADESAANSAEIDPTRLPLAYCLPKLTDFGLAQLLDRSGVISDPGLAVGTPNYMAPEQALGDGDISEATDVWALGAVLYEMLTGRAPFRASTAMDTLRLVVEATPIPPRQLNPAVPRDLESICLKCLHKSPPCRYAKAKELADDLKAFLEGRPVQARGPGWLERALQWLRGQSGTSC